MNCTLLKYFYVYHPTGNQNRVHMRKHGKHNIFYVGISLLQINPVLFLKKKKGKNIGLCEKNMSTLENMVRHNTFILSSKI